MKKTAAVLLFLFSLYPLMALPGGPVIAVAGGLTLDVAPLGVERIFLSFQGGVQTNGLLSVGAKPLLSLHSAVQTLRIPLILGINIGKIMPYAGVGIEFSSQYNEESFSPYVMGGVQFYLESLFIDIPLSIVRHGNNPDTDIAFLAGVHF